jgi:hypothetical protein
MGRMRQTAKPRQSRPVARATVVVAVHLSIGGFSAGRCPAQAPGTTVVPTASLRRVIILEHRDVTHGVVQGWINGLGVRAVYDS